MCLSNATGLFWIVPLGQLLSSKTPLGTYGFTPLPPPLLETPMQGLDMATTAAMQTKKPKYYNNISDSTSI